MHYSGADVRVARRTKMRKLGEVNLRKCKAKQALGSSTFLITVRVGQTLPTFDEHKEGKILTSMAESGTELKIKVSLSLESTCDNIRPTARAPVLGLRELPRKQDKMPPVPAGLEVQEMR